MKRVALAIAVIAILAIAAVIWRFGSETKTIPAHRLSTGVFEDQVTTNGRVEPSEWSSARAEREGLVVSVPVAKGQRVAKGAPLAVLDSSDAQADLAAANARIDEARSTIESLEAGGRKRDIVDIDQSVRQRNTELRQAEQDLAIAERLAAKNAGTREDVRALKDRVELLRVQIAALEARRPVLVSSADLASAKARLREATSAAALATRRIQLSTIRSPIDGVIYQLDARQGAYLSPGALVANIGKLDALKILVYVDEPELGRIRTGMPVKITWDAIEGKSWDGTIDKIPTQIVPLGTRQVGEVECRIANTSGDLIPGTNVNAFIETRKLEGVLLLPKEAIRERDGASGVYLIENRKLVWRKVELGSSNVTRTIVKSGLKAGDVVALGPESNLKEGATVDPSLPQS